MWKWDKRPRRKWRESHLILTANPWVSLRQWASGRIHLGKSTCEVPSTSQPPHPGTRKDMEPHFIIRARDHHFLKPGITVAQNGGHTELREQILWPSCWPLPLSSLIEYSHTTQALFFPLRCMCFPYKDPVLISTRSMTSKASLAGCNFVPWTSVSCGELKLAGTGKGPGISVYLWLDLCWLVASWQIGHCSISYRGRQHSQLYSSCGWWILAMEC